MGVLGVVVLLDGAGAEASRYAAGVEEHIQLEADVVIRMPRF